MTGRALPSHIYVACDDQGCSKVGYASNLDRRLTEIKCQRQRPVSIAWNTERRSDYRQIEYTAHSLLLAKFTGDEWFSVPAEVAVSAVQQAIRMVEAGDTSLVRRLPDWRHQNKRIGVGKSTLARDIAAAAEKEGADDLDA